MNDAEPELEFSHLSGPVTENGITVHVHIYRIAGSIEGWALEVVDHLGGSTVWEDYFPTEQDAYEGFRAAVDERGLASFAEDPGATIH